MPFLDAQQPGLPQPNYWRVVHFVELAQPVVARLTKVLVIAVVALDPRLAGEVVRVDLERDEREGGDARRLRDGHIISCLDRRTGNVTAGADPKVRSAGADTFADRLQQAVAIEIGEQAECVASTNEEGRRLTHRPHRVGVVVDTVKRVAG